MMKTIKLFALRFIAFVAVIYLAVAASLAVMPEHFYYHPDTNRSDIISARKQISGLTEIPLKTADGIDILAWYAKPKNAKKVVVFMHGNACNIGCFVSRPAAFYNAGYAVMIPEYTGFGGNKGRINQRNLEQSVAATINDLRAKGYENKDIILYGYSLGTYLAVFIAARLQDGQAFDAVILEAPLTALTDVANWASFYLLPIYYLTPAHRYNSYAMVNRIDTRLFIAHGRLDPTVPYFMGERMYAKAAEDKTFFSVNTANHQNLPEHGFLDAAIKWLRK